MEPDDKARIRKRRREFATRQFARLSQHFSTRTNETIRSRGFPEFTDAHKNVLFHLEIDGNRITTLAERARVSVQAMGKFVRDLESKGLVQREPDPSDGRAQIIKPTARGHEFFSVAVDVIEENERQIAEILGDERFAELNQALREVLEVVDPANF